MSEELKDFGIGAAVVGLITWLIKLVAGGEKKKISTETGKTQADTDSINLDNRIKAEEHYEKKYTALLLVVEDMQKKMNILQRELEAARKESEEKKIELTLEKMKNKRR